MLVESLIKRTVELQGFRVVTVSETGDGLEAELARMGVSLRAVVSAGSVLGSGTPVRSGASGMCRSGVLTCTWSTLRAGWRATAAAASMSRPCHGSPGKGDSPRP